MRGERQHSKKDPIPTQPEDDGIAPAWRLTRIPVTYDTIYLLLTKASFLILLMCKN